MWNVLEISNGGRLGWVDHEIVDRRLQAARPDGRLSREGRGKVEHRARRYRHAGSRKHQQDRAGDQLEVAW